MTTKTKPTGTSAAMTAFCQARIDGQNGLHLFIDGNAKIALNKGGYENPEPNAFSLLQISDCPGHTKKCSNFCFVHNLEKHAPETHALYHHNSKTIRQIVSDPTLSKAWAKTMGEWIFENCPLGFRHHVSGDVFDMNYARFIVNVCNNSPNVRHWIYTRSFFAVETLTKTITNNLVVNISADSENYVHARATADSFGLRVCYVTVDGTVPNDLKDGDVIFPDYSLRGGTDDGESWFDELSKDYKKMTCPVDFHGKASNRKCGPCDRCLK